MFRSIWRSESSSVCNVAPTRHDTTNETYSARIVEFVTFQNVMKSCTAGTTWDVFRSVFSSESKSACNIAPTRHDTTNEITSARFVEFCRIRKCQEKLIWWKQMGLVLHRFELEAPGTCFAPF